MAFCFLAIFTANDDADMPNLSLVIPQLISGCCESSLQTKRCKTCWPAGRRTAWYMYIRLMSVVSAIWWCQNRRSTSTKEGCTMGARNNWSFNDTPDAVLAETSKTTWTWVVKLDAFLMICIRRLYTSLQGFTKSDTGTGLVWFVSKYSLIALESSCVLRIVNNSLLIQGQYWLLKFAVFYLPKCS